LLCPGKVETLLFEGTNGNRLFSLTSAFAAALYDVSIERRNIFESRFNSHFENITLNSGERQVGGLPFERRGSK
jgi:hypothetical protein